MQQPALIHSDAKAYSTEGIMQKTVIKQMLNKSIAVIAVIFGIWGLAGCQTGPVNKPAAKEESGPLRAGDFFPQTTIPVPANAGDRLYLGLSETAKTFTLSDVEADVILVEIMNTYCYSCKKQARANRKLFNLISNDPDTKSTIKILGLAVGNSADDVRRFREEFRVDYPIIPDPGFQLHSATGFSKTPYSLFIRKDPNTGQGLIVKTHLGANIHYDRIFAQLSALRSENATPAMLPTPSTAETATKGGSGLLSKEEIEQKVQLAFCSLGMGTTTEIEELPLPISSLVYSGKLKRGERIKKVFAIIEYRTVPCDVCYDAHFLYVIDDAGKVLKFQSIHLSKADNVPWDHKDVSKIQSRIGGKLLYENFPFNPEVDAISSATITTQVIYDSISDGQGIYQMLKKKGLLQ